MRATSRHLACRATLASAPRRDVSGVRAKSRHLARRATLASLREVRNLLGLSQVSTPSVSSNACKAGIVVWGQRDAFISTSSVSSNACERSRRRMATLLRLFHLSRHLARRAALASADAARACRSARHVSTPSASSNACEEVLHSVNAAVQALVSTSSVSSNACESPFSSSRVRDLRVSTPSASSRACKWRGDLSCEVSTPSVSSNACEEPIVLLAKVWGIQSRHPACRATLARGARNRRPRSLPTCLDT